MTVGIGIFGRKYFYCVHFFTIIFMVPIINHQLMESILEFENNEILRITKTLQTFRFPTFD